MTSKPIVTCSGHEIWSQEIQKFCFGTLAMEPHEWIRSKDVGGKHSRLVHVDVNFQRFEIHSLPLQKTDAIDKPVAHLFVTVNDVDHFKTHAKQPFANWLRALQDRKIEDWLVVLINEEPMKIHHRILKQTVVDHIRSYFGVKSIDKFSFVLDEATAVQRSDSWMQLLNVIRSLVLQSYDRILSSYEESVCHIREERYESDWNYFSLFAIQEDLACIYESLCLYEDALTQYDELEAIFMQCVDAHRGGERQTWLTSFCQLPCVKLYSVFLTNYLDYNRRSQVHTHCVCLLDFRAYLLSRQCSLLLMLSRAEEVPIRAHSSIISALHEAKYLKMSSSAGLLDCWIYLGCMQVIQSCERFCNPLGPGRTMSNAGAGHHSTCYHSPYLRHSASHRATPTLSLKDEEIDLMSRTTVSVCGEEDKNHSKIVHSPAHVTNMSQGEAMAELHRLAFVHLRSLGVLCELWPLPSHSNQNENEDSTISSVALALKKAVHSAAAPDDDDPSATDFILTDNSPESRLKRCLTSAKYFQEVYAETALLCIGILKHNNRLRMAHLVSLDLADFYCLLGDFERAEKLYTEALQVYQRERWNSLQFLIYQKLAKCQKSILSNPLNFHNPLWLERYIKTCIRLSSSFSPSPYRICLSSELREYYWKEIHTTLKQFNPVSEQGNNALSSPLFHQAYPLVEVIELAMQLPIHANEPSKVPHFGFRLRLRSYAPMSELCKITLHTNRLNDRFDPDAAYQQECEIRERRRRSSFFVHFHPLASLHEGVPMEESTSFFNQRPSCSSQQSIEFVELKGCKKLIACDRIFSCVDDSGDSDLVSINPGLNEYILLEPADGIYWPIQLCISLFNANVCLLNNVVSKCLSSPSMKEIRECLPSIHIPDIGALRVLQTEEEIHIVVRSGRIPFPGSQCDITLHDPQEERTICRSSLLQVDTQTSEATSDESQRCFTATLKVIGRNTSEKFLVKIERWCSLLISIPFHHLFKYQLVITKSPILNRSCTYVQLILSLTVPNCRGKVCLTNSELKLLLSSLSVDVENIQPLSKLMPISREDAFQEIITASSPFTFIWRINEEDLSKSVNGSSPSSSHPTTTSFDVLTAPHSCHILTLLFTTHLMSFPWRSHDSPASPASSSPHLLTQTFNIPISELYT